MGAQALQGKILTKAPTLKKARQKSRARPILNPWNPLSYLIEAISVGPTWSDPDPQRR